jgi:hypothetical protein
VLLTGSGSFSTFELESQHTNKPQSVGDIEEVEDPRLEVGDGRALRFNGLRILVSIPLQFG